MKKTTVLLILAMGLAGIMSSCQRKYVTEDKTVTIHYKDGSTVTKKYTQSAPNDSTIKAETPKEKMPKLSACKAKRLVKKQMKKDEQIVLTEPITIGYYECNCEQQRSQLFKLAANNIITFSCEEIMHEGQSSYWVNVALTWKGKLLRVDEDKKLYPEDMIDWVAAKPLLTPHRDQDNWGIPTYDNQVDSVVIKGMMAFYGALANGLTIESSLLSADMQCAMYLLDALRSFDVEKITPNPFYRTLALNPDMVAQMQILRMPRLENGYMVSLGGEDFLYAMEVVDGKLEIKDVVCVTPNDDKKLAPTVCSVAGTITEKEILQAREIKRRNDELKEKMAQLQLPVKAAKEVVEEEHFEMCNIGNQGIARVEHSDPTLYELAKQAENKQVVQLRAAKWVVKKVRDIKVEKEGETYKATAVVVKRLSRVSAVGRIYQSLEQGKIEKINVTFNFDIDEGWKVGDCAQTAAPKAACCAASAACAPVAAPAAPAAPAVDESSSMRAVRELSVQYEYVKNESEEEPVEEYPWF